MKKQKKLIQSLQTLEKIERYETYKLQPQLAVLKEKIKRVDEAIEKIHERLEKERSFLHHDAAEYIQFYKRMSMELEKLHQQKIKLEKEMTPIHDEMMEHVLTEKSYQVIREKNQKIVQKKIAYHEEMQIADIVGMRYKPDEQ